MSSPEPPLLDIKALAERLGISYDYAGRLCAKGEIATTRIGRRVRITEASLAEFVARNTAKPRSSRKGAAA